MQNELLTATEAATFLKVSVKTLEAWRRTGMGPGFIKIGSRIIYRISDLVTFLDANRHYSTSEYGVKRRA